MDVGLEEFLKQVPTIKGYRNHVDRENYSSKACYLLHQSLL